MITILISDEPIELTWDQWEERVSSGRIPPSTPVRFEPVTGDAFTPAEDLEIYHSLLKVNVARWREAFRDAPPPLMCAILVGVQIRIWWLLWSGRAFNEVEWTYLSAPAIYEDGEIWRLLTMGFIHFDIGHILSNLAVMLFVGWNLERALGHWNLLTIFCGSVVGGSLFSIWMSPETPSIGASGGVFGLVAAATAFGFSNTDILPPKARRVFGWAIFPYLIFMFSTGWMDENVDNWAHFGGLLSGICIALVLSPPTLGATSWKRFGSPFVWVITVFASVILWLGGPRILPIVDTNPATQLTTSTRSVPSKQPYRPLNWHAPIGWERLSGPNGLPLYVSPQSDDRAWGLRVRKTATPTSINSLFDDWTTRLAENNAIPNERDPTPSSSIQDTPTYQRTYDQPGSPPKRVVLRIGVNGLHVYEELWQIPLSQVNRLEPLRKRLLNTVQWSPPSTYMDARREFKRRPKKYKVRARFAMSQLEWGEVESATETFKKLLQEDPLRPSAWTGLIHAASWYPERSQKLDEITSELVKSQVSPQVYAALALAHHENGSTAMAKAILDAAWERNPGDRSLRRQRDRMGLSNGLINNLPNYLYWNQDTAKPNAFPSSPSSPITLDELTQRTKNQKSRSVRLKEWLKEGLSDDPLGVTSGFIFASTGTIPSETELLERVEQLSIELNRIQFGSRPAWVDEELVQTIRETQAQKPSWLQDMIQIASAITVKEQPERLGKSIATGMGPQDLLEREQILFLSQEKKSDLLLRIGFIREQNKESMSDLGLTNPPI